jgi:hypothetical protein
VRDAECVRIRNAVHNSIILAREALSEGTREGLVAALDLSGGAFKDAKKLEKERGWEGWAEKAMADLRDINQIAHRRIEENPGPRRSAVFMRGSGKLAGIFGWAFQLVTNVDSRLGRITLGACDEVRSGMRGHARKRAFMHVAHQPDMICVAPEAVRLSKNYLLGLFLHEFGHIATDSPDDRIADAWVCEKLGITIQYRGPLCLEWVKL